ncbi:anthranilate synthase component I [Micromonospora endophytica]|uniref:Anthranilate synthase component 1 n=1 Tax=Micromonospora endophytica TaxID=515350 RepID=A0A2W2DXE3_9ACTN|nr:anthranilate synthase component I [Micromonospora endophytica]PZF97533.1 anthranilate synthase component I [Micromonospora endophytica]RIW41581.1 anthranilate synthase component I [Micromonospora endophytica]BCJ61209.1 anthranilate synthase component I [Micromonospora endophytica]
MSDGMVSPDLTTFTELAARWRVVPVTRRLLADAETPVGVYRKLAGGPGTFLLESAEQGVGSSGVSWSRYSFVGVRSSATLVERDGVAAWLGTPPAGLPTTGDPVAVLRETVATLAGPPADPEAALPPLTGGMVGYLGYDLIRRFERLPTLTEDDLHLPELGMMLATDLVVLDHFDGSAILVANAILPPPQEPGRAAMVTAAYHHAVGRLDAMTTALSRPIPPMVATVHRRSAGEVRSRTPDGGYPKAVEAAKEAIRAGECFQIVLAQRFERDTDADPLDVYRVLRTTNPSPYMYLLRFDGFDIVGSSPEAHLKVTGEADGERRALLHPIAGTRPRGATPEADARLAAELLADPKERAEHVMLVDLGRNDLGRVCRPGTVEVPEFATIERYSHVMHIVSTVVGTLRADRTAFDALAATFPAGTLSGAPKVRAMEIIEELEPVRRGLYGGTVGYFGFGGDLDMAIAIRTALIRAGRAYVQAGAGVVADSDPAAEDQETRNKAAAVLAAIAAAETLRPAR